MIVRGGEVHDPVGNDWAGWEGPEYAGLVDPLWDQSLHVVWINLIKPAIALVGIAVAIGEPVMMVFVRVKKSGVIYGSHRTTPDEENGSCCDDNAHTTPCTIRNFFV